MTPREFIGHMAVIFLAGPGFIALAYWARFDAPIWGAF